MSYAAVSVDGLYAAIVRDGELSLYTVEPFVEIARTQIAPHAERTITFVGRQVLVYDTTRLTVFSIPRKLAQTAQLELDPPARLLATSQHYALLANAVTAVASCTNDGTALAPTRTPIVVEHAVGLENAKFLLWTKKGPAEMWDAATRLPSARVGLELPPDTIDVGTTGKHRSVWIATAGGDLITSRLSDGKAVVAALPRPAQRIASHPASAWLVMDFDGEPHAVNSVLRTWQRLDIPTGRPRALAPSVGSHAYVIVDEGAEVARYEVGVDATSRAPVRIPVGAQLPDGDDTVPAAQPSPIIRVEQRRFGVEQREAPPAAPVRVEPAPVEAAPTLASRFASRDREPARARPSFARAAVPAADFHDGLLQWSKRVLNEAPTAELPPLESPIGVLADRAKLDISARRVLHVLYADWLAGHGDVGLAASKLVDIAGPTAWQEALGNGQLGKLGLVRSQVGRCLLARQVGGYFDGREPDHARRVDGAGKRDGIEDGAYRVRAAITHEQLAAALGTLGVGSFEGDKARLDAWLRSWPAVVVAMTPTELRPGELVIVPGENAGLPELPGV